MLFTNFAQKPLQQKVSLYDFTRFGVNSMIVMNMDQ